VIHREGETTPTIRNFLNLF